MKPHKKEAAAEDVFGFILENDHKKLDSSLKNGYDINRCSDDGMTPLMIAVMDNNFAMVDYLLSKGAGIDDRHVGIFGMPHNALSVAYTLKPVNYQMVDHLLNKGARFDRGDLLLAQKDIMLLFILNKYKQNYVRKIPTKTEPKERYQHYSDEELNEIFRPSHIQKELEKVAQ